MAQHNFNTMRLPPTKKASSYLKHDWSAEEKSFKNGISDFQKRISPCNEPLENPCYVYKPEENVPVQVPATQGVAKGPEKKCEIPKDESTRSVESGNVRLNSATLPTLRREVKVTQDPLDPFAAPIANPPKQNKASDDFFDIEQAAPAAAPSLPPTKPSSKVVDPFDDFVAPAPKAPAKPVPPPETKKPMNLSESLTKVCESVIKHNESAHGTCDVPKPRVDKVVEEIVKEEDAKVIASCVAATEDSLFPSDSPLRADFTPAELENLDLARFNKIRKTVMRMLEEAPNHDLKKLTWNIGEDYKVEMDLDPHRENPNILSQKIIQIQAQRDSLYGEALRVNPVYDSFKGAEKYLRETAIDCSTRKSAESRMAHIKMLLPEFYVRLNAIERAKDNIDKALERLTGQYDCISRLVTTLQQKIKIGEISRGAAPWEEAAEIKVPVVPKSSEDDDMVNRSMSQPLPVKKFNNMETFDPSVKTVKKNSQARGFTDF